MSSIALSPTHAALIRQVLHNTKDVRLFGSRVRGTNSPFSDIDVCVCDTPPPTDTQIQLWREAFDESNLPFVVDLSRLLDLPPFLQDVVRREGVSLTSLESHAALDPG